MLNAFGLQPSGVGETGTASAALNYWDSFVEGGQDLPNAYPKAFVNLIVFDRNYGFLDAAWNQIDGGEQIGVSPKAAHDYMTKEYIVKEEGYIFAYVSNENTTAVEVYFDDVVITRTKSNVIQYSEYYPFGLQTASSWTRENAVDNKYLYNDGNELNDKTGWYEMFFRGYDPATGRMLQVDPYATQFASASVYNYALGNPVMVNDPSGGVAGKPRTQQAAEWQLAIMNAAQEAALYGTNNNVWDNVGSPLGEGLQTVGSANYSGGAFGVSLSEFLHEANASSFGGTWSSDGTSTVFNSESDVAAAGYFVSNPYYTIENSAGTTTADGIYVSADTYVGQLAFSFVPFDPAVVLDANGNVTRWDEGANNIFVDFGNGRAEKFRDQLARNDDMKPEAFSNALLSIVNGMKLPKGYTFETKRLYNGGKIAISMVDGTMVYTDVAYVPGKAAATANSTNGLPEGMMIIRYQGLAGDLTVDRLRSILGYHEYYGHGIELWSHSVSAQDDLLKNIEKKYYTDYKR